MVRPPLAVLNDLPVPDWTTDREAPSPEAAVADFVTLLRRIRALRGDIALVANQHIGNILVDRGALNLAAYLNQRGGPHRERWRFIQSLRNHAPFSAAPMLRMTDGAEEYRWQGERAEGLGLAAANRQLAVSMVPERWTEYSMALERCWLNESEHGEIEEQTSTVDVIHASTPIHANHHADVIRALALPDGFSGRDLWTDRDALYPNLRFTSRVEAQLVNLSFAGEAIEQVGKRLEALQASVASWDPSIASSPEWRTRVTPEGEQGKKHCWFTDLDGTTRCFDLHARFTPGAGRVHFRLAPEGRAPLIVIAHVGPKLHE